MGTSVFCIAPTQIAANEIVSRLKSADFESDDISLLFPDSSSPRAFAHEIHTKSPEGIAYGGCTGGFIGGSIGLLAGLGLLAIPGAGPFIAAGPILGGLSGLGGGGMFGAIIGGIIGLGIPEIQAMRYDGKMRDGNILISVHTETSADVKRAKNIFAAQKASDIATCMEAALPPDRVLSF